MVLFEHLLTNPLRLEVTLVNTGNGPVLYQTGDIYASDNGTFYQVITLKLI